jgi:NDP-sugar pyrophosphorylase family protein
MTMTELASYKKNHTRRGARKRKNDHGEGLDKTPVVILAGGRGTRLAPYTSILPKPLMPVGERAILEIVIEQLAAHGVRKVNLCVGYLAHLIQAVFDHRDNRDVEIEYVHERDALGTAAPLLLVDGLDDTFIAMNGDVLTTLDYGDLVRHHCESGNILTIATHERMIKIDYGMLDIDVTSRVRGFHEKPEITSSVSMGIYVIEPSALEYIPEDTRFDFPDLVHELLDAGEAVGAYRYRGTWFDIGRTDDYEAAAEAWSQNGDVHSHGREHANGNGNLNGHDNTHASGTHATGAPAGAADAGNEGGL